jgi:hypothetical protein
MNDMLLPMSGEAFPKSFSGGSSGAGGRGGRAA